MKLRSTILAMAIAAGMLSGACSSTSPGGTGGTGTGGNSGTGGTDNSCANTPNVTACGGVVTGTWTVAPTCLKVSGEIDLRSTFGTTCQKGQISGSLTVSGTWTAKADKTFVDDTTTKGTEQIILGSDCKVLSMAPVTCEKIGTVMAPGYFESASCTDAPGGGCKCTGVVNQKGSMGVVTASPNTDGNYTIASNTITITDDNSGSTYPYCVAGTKLTVTPQSSGPTLTGTIVLESGASSTGGSGGGGTGGSSGTGGAVTGGSGGSGVTGGAGGAPRTGGSGGGTSTGGSTNPGTRTDGPCDIYAAANVPCGAAYSMVRALSKSYTGFLYQIRIGSSATNTGTGGTLKDIGMTADGYADTAAVDAACPSGTICTVATLYDQSGNKNDLLRGPAGLPGNGDRSGENDYESNANGHSVTAGGHKVYVLYMNKFEGYRTPLNFMAKGTANGKKDQGIYELADGTHFGTACCWDFGSVSPDPKKYVTMNTLFFGTGFWGSGAPSGPWFMGDFEGGVWAGGTGGSNVNNPMNPSMKVPFAFGVLHTPVGKYALRMADAATATDLVTAYDGGTPNKTWDNAGGIALGIGGDNSNNSSGTFYEGAMTNGSPSNATDLLILKNIQAVAYKK